MKMSAEEIHYLGSQTNPTERLLDRWFLEDSKTWQELQDAMETIERLDAVSKITDYLKSLTHRHSTEDNEAYG